VPGCSGPCLGIDSDEDGICDRDECDPEDPSQSTSPGDPCDDGNPRTINDIIDENCNCNGHDPSDSECKDDQDGDGVCDDSDCWPADPTRSSGPGDPCDDGDSNTSDDKYDDNCFCKGVSEDNPCDKKDTSYTPETWDELYSIAYDQQKNLGNNYKTPSEVKNSVANIGLYSNSLELMYLVTDIEVPTGTESVMACGLVVPNRRVFGENCEVKLNFPCHEIEDGLNSTCPERALSNVSSIQLSVGGSAVTQSISCGETVTLDLYQIFEQNIQFEVSYKNGDVSTFNLNTNTSPYLSYPDEYIRDGQDYYLYPDCIGPPPVLSPGPGGPPVGPTCPTCPLGPPELEDCWIQPNFRIHSVSELGYYNHIPTNPEEDEDFQKYSTGLNPAVYTSPIEDIREANSRGIIDADVYLNPNHTKLTKPVIITDGIDFFSSRNGREILNNGLNAASVQVLFEHGLDVIIADYRGGADFMQKNAFALIDLIDDVQQKIGEDNQIEAIVGPSMGGQIVRYALQYWQVHEEKKRGKYRIGTFLSADSPWLGANASPAMQAMASIGKDITDQDLSSLRRSLEVMDKLPNSPAARQLLVHHSSGLQITEPGDINSFIYQGVPHPFRQEWLDDLGRLESLTGGEFVGENGKINVVAVADGSINGTSTVGDNENPIVEPAGVIASFDVSDRLPWGSGEIKLYSTWENSHLINYWGNWEDPIEKRFRAHFPIETVSETIRGWDSHPGSPFRLSSYLKALKVDGLEIENDFTFIPTFSALAISQGAGNRDLDLTGEESDVFDDYFVDNTNSGHNDFLQEGTLDFFMEQIETEKNDLDPCWFFENIMIGSRGVCVGDRDIPTVYYGTDNDISGTNFKIPDLRVFDSNLLDIIQPEISVEITHPGSCGVIDAVYIPASSDNGPLGDCDGDGILNNVDDTAGCNAYFEVSYEGDDCFAEAEICFSSDACPSLNSCHFIKIKVNSHGNVGMLSQNGLEDTDTFENDKESSSSGTDDGMKSDKESDFIIYPNPTYGQIKAKIGSGEYQVEIYRVNGGLVKSINLNKSQRELNIDLPAGGYIFKALNIGTNSLHIEKVIVL